MTDHASHPRIMRRLYRDPRAAELLMSYRAQIAVLAAQAFARRGGFSLHRLDVSRARRRAW
jgi:hypothetical protein